MRHFLLLFLPLNHREKNHKKKQDFTRSARQQKRDPQTKNRILYPLTQ